jgi:hypothetical protein
MATNRNLRNALLKYLGVTPQRLSQRVKKMKSLHGPMMTEEVTYVIAHQEGFDLTKYLDGEIVDRVRGLVPSGAVTPPPSGKTVKKNASKPAKITISIAGQLPNVDVLLSVSTARDAAKMAELYPVYYVLEKLHTGSHQACPREEAWQGLVEHPSAQSN